MNAAESARLNEAIEKICDDETLPEVIGLAGSGKRIAYIGWYWRTVDFTARISLGRCRTGPSVLEQLSGLHGRYSHSPSWAGFMENNKWGYPEWYLTAEQSAGLIERLKVATAEPTQRNLQACFDFMQATMPDDIRNWDGRTEYDDWLEQEAARQ